MSETILLAQALYSGYISLAKFLPLVACFYLWLLFINWVYFDTKAVQTKTLQWLLTVIISGAAAILVWLFVPVYIIGLLLFLIIAGATSIVYVIHRNALVADFEKVLTLDHIKGLFANEKKKLEKSARGFSFITANDNPVEIPEPKSKELYGFQIACQLFDDALWRRVSQIKMLPGAEEYNVTYEIDGLVTQQDPIEVEKIGYFIYFIKHLADLNVEEKRKPQKSKFKTEKQHKKTTWNVQTAGSTSGEYIVITRDEEFSQMDLSEVGFEPDQIKELKKMKGLHSGLFLVAGSRSSGLTTTFYALLRNHDPFLYSINTVEKRPAGELSSITQNIHDPIEAKGQTYAQRFQFMVRMGLDIAGVGDCDDSDTAKLACNTAKNKLVYVSIEAKDTIQAIARWLDLVPDKKLALRYLAGIASTRLVRVLCDECKEEYEPNPEMLKKIGIAPGKVEVLYRPGETQYTRGGKPILCDKCQGAGYYGRTAVVESFVLPEKAKEEILNAESVKEIALVLRRNGMKFLQERIVEKVVEGVTSVNEMARILKANAAGKAPTNRKQSSK